MRWVRSGGVLACVVFAAIASSGPGCSSGGHGGGGAPTDAAGDLTFPTYDAGVYEGGDDGGPIVGDAGEAGPLPVAPAVYLVNASPDAPPLRFCLGLGSPDAGVLVTAGLPPTPDHVTAAAAYPGIFPGFGALLGDHGLDLDAFTIAVFALDASNPLVAGDLFDAGPDGGLELACASLVGSDGRGASSDAGGVLREGQDYWYVGTIPMGQLGHATTWLAAVTGCVPGDAQGAAVCPAGYDAATGNLQLQTWQLDTTTAIDGGAMGAQFAQASSEWDHLARTSGGATVAGFEIPSEAGATDAAVPESGAGDAATPDAGSSGAAFTAIPIATDAGFGSLTPAKLAAVRGLTFDGATSFFAAIVDDAGAPVTPTPFAFPLTPPSGGGPSVASFTWGAPVPDGGAPRDGTGYVFVLVGNPAASSLYVNPADGGPASGADAGVLNGHYPHFLAFPVAGP